ncbi:hypothetical protein ACFQ0K_12035 [Nocardioides caeni]|uniref:Uncharacterized protein n=1 Tax=Nocardioides caeni TaxID=574700 RepID=A0A4S8NMY4_9ACTN|nr:hypothetical protein [Nocardioides caeni]THV17831.1 hypothetical protein E9934_05035 [Nocardioides caeni]
MPFPVPAPPRVPQRVLVAAAPGPALNEAVERLAGMLDLPLVLAQDLGARDAARLAAFDGWVATIEDAVAGLYLLPRADLLLQVQVEVAGTLRGFVRRTVRRMRSDTAPEIDLSWIDTVATSHPELPLVRLTGPEEIAAWLDGIEGLSRGSASS